MAEQQTSAPRPRPEVVLGISPGGRWTGLAVLEGDELIRFTVITTCRYAGTATRFRQRLARLVAEVRPDRIVVEEPEFRRQNRETAAVDRVIATVVAGCEVPVVHVRLTAARRTVVGDRPRTRAIVHSLLSERFPVLARSTHARPGSRWWSGIDRYWERAFAALTLAVHLTYGTQPPSTPTGTPGGSGAAGASHRSDLGPAMVRRPGAK